MIPNEITTNFREKYAEPLHQEFLTMLEQSLEGSFDEITRGIIDLYHQFFESVKQAQSNGKGSIAYVNFYLLRSSLKLGNDTCLLCAYNKDWYLDTSPIERTYSAPFLFTPYYDYKKKLGDEMRKYIKHFTNADLDSLLLEKWNDYAPYMVLLLKSSIDKIIALPSYDFAKDTMFTINAGEYMDYVDTLRVEDNTEKILQYVKNILQGSFQQNLRYLHLHNMDLSQIDCSERDLSGSRFVNVDLQNNVMGACLLIDAIFTSCDLKGAILAGSQIWCSNFSGSNLENADLSYANIYSTPDYAKMSKKYFPKIKFSNANLCGANLSHGNFSYSDFSGAKLKDCDFTEAILHNSIMDKSLESQLSLSDKQKGEIQWVTL